MKKIKRILLVSCVLLTIGCMTLFTGCKDDGTDAGTATATPKTTPTATPAANTPTPTPTAEAATATATATAGTNGKNLLDFAIEDDPLLLGGDSWAPIEETWAGPLQEVRDGCESPAQQELIEETRADGTEDICYHFYSEAEEGFHIIGNTMGITDLVEANKTYQLTVSLKYTVPNPGGERDNMAVGCNAGAAPATKVQSSEEWQTVTYTFTVGENFETVYIYVGPVNHPHESIVIGEIQAGFDLLIDHISLVEVQ